MKLSIIVPVYNVEKYLVRCLDSIAVEMCDDYELLLVDDGSTDTSGAMCDDFAREHPGLNVVVIHQPNGGLSAARNAGIDRARGEYLTFVDSDDYIDAHSLSRNMEFLTAHPEVDILEYPIEVHAGSPDAHVFTFSDTTQRTDVFADWVFRGGYTHCYACNKIYRSNILLGIRFARGRYFEDGDIMPFIVQRCRCFHYSSMGCYRYVLHSGSITTNYKYIKQKHLFENNFRLYLSTKDNVALRAESLNLWIYCLNLLVDMGRCADVDEADYRHMVEEAEKQSPSHSDMLKIAVKNGKIKFFPLPVLGLRNYLRCYVALTSRL